jgi:uncharacterized membrane protein YhaH (DUF805 family)
MKWYLKVLKNYAVFNGRAGRQEYWMSTLVHYLIFLGLTLAPPVLQNVTETDQNILRSVYSLAVFIPRIAVSIRRMHDTDRSGWWYIVPIVGLIFAIEDGQPGTNQYGADPKGMKKSNEY